MNRYLEDRLRRRYWAPRSIEHARRVMRKKSGQRPLVLRIFEQLCDYVNLLAGVVLAVGTAFFVFPLLLLPQWYGYGLFVIVALVVGVVYGLFAVDVFLLEKVHHVWGLLFVFVAAVVAMWFVCVRVNDVANILGLSVYYDPLQVSLSYGLLFLLPLSLLLVHYRSYIFSVWS